MTAQEIIEKIRAEVNRMKPRIRKICGEEVKIPVEKVREKFDTLLSILSDLEKECEKPTNHKDIDTEIGHWLSRLDDKYCMLVNNYSIQDIKDTASYFAKWGAEHAKECEECPSRGNTHSYLKGLEDGKKEMKEQMMKELSDKIAAAYQLGLSDKEKQMMKEAVEVKVQPSPLNGPLGISAYCCNFPSKYPFYHCKEGDKVELIIVKEEENGQSD